MMVYFVRIGNDGLVKIGCTSFDVEKRRRALQIRHNELLHILREIPGDVNIERGFHQMFILKWMGGEWFIFDETMLTAEIDPLMHHKRLPKKGKNRIPPPVFPKCTKRWRY